MDKNLRKMPTFKKFKAAFTLSFFLLSLVVNTKQEKCTDFIKFKFVYVVSIKSSIARWKVPLDRLNGSVPFLLLQQPQISDAAHVEEPHMGACVFPLWCSLWIFITPSHCSCLLFYFFPSLWEVALFVFQLLGFSTVWYTHSQNIVDTKPFGHLGA